MSSEGARKLGERLRISREEKELSLKEVENATSIRMSCLRAIEEGEMDKLISPVYALGFIKQYAAFLGLNPDKTVEEYKGFLGPLQKQEFAYGIGTLETRNYPGSSSKWFPMTAYLLTFVLMLLLAWYFAWFLGVI